jgi:hypothetical protein
VTLLHAEASDIGTLRVAGRTILIPSQNGAVIVASTWAAGVAGLVLIAGLVVVAVATFRDRVPEGGLLLGVLGLSIVYNLVDDHGDVWLLAIPPILGVLREPIARAVAPRFLDGHGDKPGAEPSRRGRPLGQYVAAWFILVVLVSAAAVARCHWGRLREPLTECFVYIPAAGAFMAVVAVIVAVIERGRARRRTDNREG